jgi:hypothetical protein
VTHLRTSLAPPRKRHRAIVTGHTMHKRAGAPLLERFLGRGRERTPRLKSGLPVPH